MDQVYGSPVQDDVVVALVSGQLVGGRDSGDGQQRLQQHGQTVINRVGHLDVLLTPAGAENIQNSGRVAAETSSRNRAMSSANSEAKKKKLLTSRSSPGTTFLTPWSRPARRKTRQEGLGPSR